MKKNIAGSVIFTLVVVILMGCMDPFGDNNNAAVDELDTGGQTAMVAIDAAIGAGIGASSIFNPPEFDQETQDFWVDVMVYNSAGRRIAESNLEPVLDGSSNVVGYSANLRLETGSLTFIVVARVYTWDTDSSEYLYYGETTRTIVTGSNSVTIATSSYANLSTEIQVNNIPSGYESVMVGIVGDGFDIHDDIINPYIASGFSWRALDSIVSRVFIAGGEGAVNEEGLGEVLMREWGLPRPWQVEGTHNVLVMLQNHLDMWVPGTLDGFGDFVPFIGQAYIYSPDYFGAVSLYNPSVTEYQGFNYLIASESGVIVDLSGILSPKGETSLLDADGEPIAVPTDEWYVSAAVFPAGWNVFNEFGELQDGAEPFAQGAVGVELNDFYFDGNASLGLFVDFFGGGDQNGDDENGGGMPLPWFGTLGSSYEIYVLVYRYPELEGSNEEMYIAGADVEGFFTPTKFEFVFTERPLRVPIDVSGLNFMLFPGGGGGDPGIE